MDENFALSDWPIEEASPAALASAFGGDRWKSLKRRETLPADHKTDPGKSLGSARPPCNSSF